jgi:hypothetical protein
LELSGLLFFELTSGLDESDKFRVRGQHSVVTTLPLLALLRHDLSLFVI